MKVGPYETGRVYAGDCLSLLTEIPDEAINLVWTDPPYGAANMDGDLAEARALAGGAGASGMRVAPPEPIANDRPEDYAELLIGLATALPRVLASTSAVCICAGGGGPATPFLDAQRIVAAALEFDHLVIWNKRDAGPGMGWIYRRCYETIIVAHKRGGTLAHPSNGGKARTLDNVLNIPALRAGKLHPNQKPGELIRKFLRLHGQPGDLVVDPFAGSGETGVQALALGMEFLGFELSEKHTATANERLGAAIRGNDPVSERAGQHPLAFK